MTAWEPPRPSTRRRARGASNPRSEGARRHGRAACPGVREDRVSHIPRHHGTVKRWIMTRPSAGPPGEPLGVGPQGSGGAEGTAPMGDGRRAGMA
jgi:hypothetical protein